MAEIVPIPGPPGYPVLGNITDVDPLDSMASLERIGATYGEIFKLTLGGTEKLFITSNALANELCDEKRFTKAVVGALDQLRLGVHDGLFTANTNEHNWEIAHRTLMSAFGPLSVKSMFDEMHDIATQLVVKWARFGDQDKIDVTSDLTKLTLDSIALCAMGARFNSFYKEELHPFVGAMTDMLLEAGLRANRPRIANFLFRASETRYQENINLLQQVAQELVDARKAHPTEKKDLLNAMLHDRDPKTGEAMTEQSIIDNMITFMIAGHETTSGMLSFLFYFLLKNPSTYLAAQKEVEQVIGRGPITIDHMTKLPYITACLRECLRLTPTAPAFTVKLRDDAAEDTTIIGGKYLLPKGQPVIMLLPSIHKDPAVYGDDAGEFKPERMLDEAFGELPPNAWKPFGNGARGCIGRSFAWQEAILAVAMLLQNFDIRMEDPSYTLKIKQTLTLKPKDFFIRASLKEHIDLIYLERNLQGGPPEDGRLSGNQTLTGASDGKSKQPMTVLYGSNAGTCEALAQSLARAGGARGFEVKVMTLDSAMGKVPTEQPVVVICSSYEGLPPDNAAQFCAWIDELKAEGTLKGVKYAIYGCGNHDWVKTFHKVPKMLHNAFKSNGASALVDVGLGDVAVGDIFNDFDSWQDEQLWPALGGSNDAIDDNDALDIKIDTASRSTKLRQDVKEAIVLSNDLLTPSAEIGRRHIELQLPTGMTYKSGDYLSVLPINNSKTIRRVLKRFSLPWDAMLTISTRANTTLPTGQPISAMDVLGAFVELSQPATKRNVHKIANSISDDEEREQMLKGVSESFEALFANKRLSPLDILEAHPNASLGLASFLEMLPPMRIRQYSISSSPLANAGNATLTWTVLDSPSKATDGKRYLGVASNYLSCLEVGDRVHVAVQPSKGSFHPPSDIENTPMIMLCAGSGIAPFRGFIQERAIQAAAGRKLAEAHIFIGCRHPDQDVMFKDELVQWEKDGIVKTYYAYSKAKEQSKGARYVQERFWEEREQMVDVFQKGAKVYICGSASVGEGVAATMKRIYADWCEDNGEEKTDDEVEAWFLSIRGERYASDVFV